MSLMFWLLLVLGLITLVSAIIIISSLAASKLRTVPPLEELDPVEIMFLPAEARVGLKLHEACFHNNAQGAQDALVKWMWVTGEAAQIHRLENDPTTLGHPEIADAVIELWAHLEDPQSRPWFGDKLWRAFTAANPKFREMEITYSG